MGQNIDLELKVIKRFVDDRRQERYLQFIAQPKNRQKFINELPHFRDFKWSLFEEVNKDEQQFLFLLLQKYKLTDKNCYIISFDPEIDTATMEVRQAIEEVVNYNMGTILVFGDAEFIFYGGEELKSRYVSKLIQKNLEYV